MNLIKTLMERRQFLGAAGVGSASAPALGKLGGIMGPIFKTHAAMAAETAGASGTKGLDYRYPNLLSPIKIGYKILKNRIFIRFHSRIGGARFSYSIFIGSRNRGVISNKSSIGGCKHVKR